MDRVIVWLDDVPRAQRQLAAERTGPTHWLLVACAPRMSQRIGKWASHGTREKWRAQWAGKLLAQIEPVLRARGDQVTAVLPTEPLPQLTRRLLAEHGAGRVVDARRPRADQPAPVIEPDPSPQPRRWPGTLVGLGAAVLLAAD